MNSLSISACTSYLLRVFKTKTMLLFNALKI